MPFHFPLSTNERKEDVMKMKATSLAFHDDTTTPTIHPNDSWRVVWEKLQQRGWKQEKRVTSNNPYRFDYYFYYDGPPHGADFSPLYLSEKQLWSQLRSTFGWKGEASDTFFGEVCATNKKTNKATTVMTTGNKHKKTISTVMVTGNKHKDNADAASNKATIVMASERKDNADAASSNMATAVVVSGNKRKRGVDDDDDDDDPSLLRLRHDGRTLCHKASKLVKRCSWPWEQTQSARSSVMANKQPPTAHKQQQQQPSADDKDSEAVHGDPRFASFSREDEAKTNAVGGSKPFSLKWRMSFGSTAKSHSNKKSEDAAAAAGGGTNGDLSTTEPASVIKNQHYTEPTIAAVNGCDEPSATSMPVGLVANPPDVPLEVATLTANTAGWSETMPLSTNGDKDAPKDLLIETKNTESVGLTAVASTATTRSSPTEKESPPPPSTGQTNGNEPKDPVEVPTAFQFNQGETEASHHYSTGNGADDNIPPAPLEKVNDDEIETSPSGSSNTESAADFLDAALAQEDTPSNEVDVLQSVSEAREKETSLWTPILVTTLLYLLVAAALAHINVLHVEFDFPIKLWLENALDTGNLWMGHTADAFKLWVGRIVAAGLDSMRHVFRILFDSFACAVAIVITPLLLLYKGQVLDFVLLSMILYGILGVVGWWRTKAGK